LLIRCLALRLIPALLFTILFCNSAVGAAEFLAPSTKHQGFRPQFETQKLPQFVVQKVKSTTWHQGCPVPVEDLRLLTLSFWNFNAQPQLGLLIVHKDVQKDVRKIFRKLFRQGFLIERMELIENYSGNDLISMGANNTSAFNCRDITLRPGKFSNHSWGRAIDINPMTNPYVKGQIVLPVAGQQYLNRNQDYKGGITAESLVTRLFERKKWTWGGTWHDRKDYQHFEKPEKAR
jgi:hypothetical protein